VLVAYTHTHSYADWQPAGCCNMGAVVRLSQHPLLACPRPPPPTLCLLQSNTEARATNRRQREQLRQVLRGMNAAAQRGVHLGKGVSEHEWRQQVRAGCTAAASGRHAVPLPLKPGVVISP